MFVTHFDSIQFFSHQTICSSPCSNRDSEKSSRRSYGGHLIASKRCKETFQPSIKSNYLDIADELLKHKAFTTVFDAELLQAKQIIHEVVHQVW